MPDDRTWLEQLFELQKRAAKLAEEADWDSVIRMALEYLKSAGPADFPWPACPDDPQSWLDMLRERVQAPPDNGRLVINTAEDEEQVQIRITGSCLEEATDVRVRTREKQVFLTVLPPSGPVIERLISLPAVVIPKQARAVRDKGLLTVSIPKVQRETWYEAPIVIPDGERTEPDDTTAEPPPEAEATEPDRSE